MGISNTDFPRGNYSQFIALGQLIRAVSREDRRLREKEVNGEDCKWVFSLNKCHMKH